MTARPAFDEDLGGTFAMDAPLDDRLDAAEDARDAEDSAAEGDEEVADV